MISSMEKETRETQNHWKCLKFTHFHDSVDGEGSVGNPESLKMFGFPTFFMISLMEKETWETQNNCKCKDFHAFFMMSLMEKEAWNPRIIENS